MSDEQTPATPCPADAADSSTGDQAPDPGAPIAIASRARGLDAPFAPGGEDDAPDARRRRERRDIRLLIAMVLALVGIPTLMTIGALVAELLSRRTGV